MGAAAFRHGARAAFLRAGIQVAIKVHRVEQPPDNGLAASDDELTLTSAEIAAELGDGLYAVEPDADPTRPD